MRLVSKLTIRREILLAIPFKVFGIFFVLMMVFLIFFTDVFLRLDFEAFVLVVGDMIVVSYVERGVEKRTSKGRWLYPV